MKDLTLQSILSGYVAVFFKDIFDYLYMRLGFKGISMIKVAAGTFISADRVSTLAGTLIGLVAHYSVGGTISLLFSFYILLTKNKSYCFLKGIVAGLTVWLLIVGPSLRAGLSCIDPEDVSSNMMLLLDHIVFGGVLGILNRKIVDIGSGH